MKKWMLYFYQYPISGTFRLMGRRLRAKIKRDDRTTRSGLRDVSSLGNEYKHPRIVEEATLGVVGDVPEICRETAIVGDNFLRMHEAALLAQAGLDRSDVAYASFEAGGFYETPYCIVIDRKWRSVVLSIRGSLTLEDCVVDVLLDPSPLDALGEEYGFMGAGQYCHGGVLECANWLHRDLMRCVSYSCVPHRSYYCLIVRTFLFSSRVPPGTEYFRNYSRGRMPSFPTIRCASSATLWGPGSGSFFH